MTGIDRRKWKASFNTFERGMKYLGKFTFFIKEAFAKRLTDEEATELENHCHGKSPVIRNRVKFSTGIFITNLKAKYKTTAIDKG